MEIIGYVILVLSGVILALIGGGGSLLSTPVMIYFFKMDALHATTYSLFVVAIGSAFGTYKYIRQKHIDIPLAIEFAIPCFISIFVVRNYALPAMPETFDFLGLYWTRDIAIMLPFGLLMGASAVKSFVKTKPIKNPKPRSKIVGLSQGLAVGAITGFVGIGGGFLITPILHFVLGLEFKKAVGTSLFVLTLNACFGFIVDISKRSDLSFSLLTFFALTSIAGIFLGFQVSKHVEEAKIKLAFSILLVITAFVVISDYSGRLLHMNT